MTSQTTDDSDISSIYRVFYHHNEYTDETSDEQVNRTSHANTSTQCGIHDQESATIKGSSASYQPLATGALKKDNIYESHKVGKGVEVNPDQP